MNKLVELYVFGQSFWYDNIRRKFLFDGTLQGLIDNDGLRGMTSNPSIFEKAIGGSDDYDEQIRSLVADGSLETMGIYEALVLADIQKACDLFADLYTQSEGGDGYVSLEVSPLLARDTVGTIEEARRLYMAVNRPNIMIKVPATSEGIPAIRQLISEGININVTLMFSMADYEAVAAAYIGGIEQLIESGGDPSRVASVASFFVSRVETAVDNQLAELGTPDAMALMGKIAVANSKVVYQRFLEIFHGESFAKLAEAGAARQRLLWASTSSKNPNYRDTIYIDELIGPETVNTMPPKTVDAFRENGRLENMLQKDVAAAQLALDDLEKLDIALDQITTKLQHDGVISFSTAFETLMNAIEEKRRKMN